MPSDSEEEIEDVDFDLDEDAEPDLEDEGLLDGIEVADDATEDGDDDSGSDDSDEGSDDDDEEASEPSMDPTLLDLELAEEPLQSPNEPDSAKSAMPPGPPSSNTSTQPSKPPSPAPAPLRSLVLSPENARRRGLLIMSGPGVPAPRTYTVEAICALPHPGPTNALAATPCMLHLLTGSDDGYIRDYDIFSAVNSKNFLSAPQRHHSGVVEGILKAGQLRFWWENPSYAPPVNGMVQMEEEPPLVPVYSLAMHSDALWALAGTDDVCVTSWPVDTAAAYLRYPSTMTKSRYSVPDGTPRLWQQWDLNTGQIVRNFTAHNAQLSGIAVRPANAVYHEDGTPITIRRVSASEGALSQHPTQETLIGSEMDLSASSTAIASQSQPMAVDSSMDQTDAKSDASFDPLFDDDPLFNEDATERVPRTQDAISRGQQLNVAANAEATQAKPQPPRAAAAPKNAPPLLEQNSYISYSPDMLMTVYIDGQIVLWDKRVHSPGTGVGRLWMSERTPPWCLSACWSADGNQIYAGRRNGSVDIWDVRQAGGSTSNPRLMKTLRNPPSSGAVSSVVAFPDSRHIACASVDNLRLWNVAEANEPDASGKMKSGVQFKIIPGHHGGIISQMVVDPGARFLVSASGNRGWPYGDSTRTVFVHEIKRFN
ncbi:Transcription factor spt8 [Pleurotus ostreatus]|nr:Transcription factor spt8 [Pleurotus ostreatus]